MFLESRFCPLIPGSLLSNNENPRESLQIGRELLPSIFMCLDDCFSGCLLHCPFGARPAWKEILLDPMRLLETCWRQTERQLCRSLVALTFSTRSFEKVVSPWLSSIASIKGSVTAQSGKEALYLLWQEIVDAGCTSTTICYCFFFHATWFWASALSVAHPVDMLGNCLKLVWETQSSCTLSKARCKKDV